MQIELEHYGEGLEFLVRPSTRLGRIFALVCANRKILQEDFRFSAPSGRLLYSDETVQSCELEAGDIICVMARQTGC